MIIVRQKDAGHLATIFSGKANTLQFAMRLDRAKTVDFIYYDNGIKTKSWPSQKFNFYVVIGELERKNIPFILLIDKVCSLQCPPKQDLTLINVNSIERDVLESFFEVKENPNTSKAELFDTMFREYLDFNKDKSFAHSFLYFVGSAFQQKAIEKESTFIAMSAIDGKIHDASSSLGRFYDEERVWCCDEMNNPIPKPVNPPEPVKVESSVVGVDGVVAFSKRYEAGACMTSYMCGQYRELDLTEIIKSYPMLFADLVRKDYSYFSRTDQQHIDNNFFEYLAEEDDDDVEDYLEEVKEGPDGYTLCYSCDAYDEDRNCKEITTEGKTVYLCNVCYNGLY